MRRLTTTVATLLALTGSLAIAPPASPGTPAYTTFVACGYQRSKPATIRPTHFCRPGEVVGAFFRRNVGEPGSLIYYKVCVHFSTGGTLCKGHQPARKLGRRLYVNRIISPGPGRHRVTWFVGGRKVGTWFFRRAR
jgi:hypothetical protein